MVAVGHGPEATLRELTTGQARRQLPVGEYLAFSQDGRRLATVQGRLVALTDLDKSGSTRHVHLNAALLSLALSPDGALLAIGCEDGSLQLYDFASGTLLTRRESSPSDLSARICALTFSRDGRQLAGAGMDATVLIWDLAALRHKDDPGPLTANDLRRLWKQLAGPDAASVGQALARLAAAPETVAVLHTQVHRPRPRRLSHLQMVRTIEVLERIGSPAARELLEKLTQAKAPWSLEAKNSLIRSQRASPEPAAPLAAKVPLRLGARQWQHGMPVFSVRPLADGKTLMTTTVEQTQGRVSFQFWDAQTGQFLRKSATPKDGMGLIFGGGIQRGNLREAGIPANILFGMGVRCLSPDGRYFASRNEARDGSIIVKDLTTGKIVAEIHSARPNAANPFVPGQQMGFALFTPDSNRLAILTDDPKAPISLYSTVNGREIHRLKAGRKNEEFTPLYFNISPDGRFLAAIGEQKKTDGVIRVWDLHNSRPPLTISPQSPRYSPMVFSPDGKRLAVIVVGDMGPTPRLRLYDAANGNLLQDLGEHPDLGPNQEGASAWTNGLFFSPDGTYLASLGEQQVAVWHVKSEKAVLTLSVTALIYQAAFTPDNRGLALRTHEAVGIYAVPSGKRQWQVALPADAMQFFPGGSSGEIAFYLRQQGFGGTLAFSADGQTLIVPSGQTLRQWQAATGKEIVPEGRQAMPSQLVVAPGGNIAAALGPEGVILWDLRTRKQIHQLQEKLTLKATPPIELDEGQVPLPEIVAAAPCCGAFAPSGKLFATGYTSGHIVLWDVVSGKRLRIWKEADQSLASLQFSADGTRVTAVADDWHCVRWEVTTGRRLNAVRLSRPATSSESARMTNHVVAYHSSGGIFKEIGGLGNPFSVVPGSDLPAPPILALSADGRLVAAARDNRLLLLELASGQPRFELPFQVAAPPFVFTPDGRYVAYTVPATEEKAGNTHMHSSGLQLVDLVERRPLRFFGPMSQTSSAAFSPDGRLFAAAGQEGVKLWDTATGTIIADLDKHRGPATAVAFTPDGRHLLSAGVDCTILFTPVADLTRKAPVRAPTRTEWENLWQQLGSSDGRQVQAALLRLAQHPAAATDLLQNRIQPAPHFSQAHLACCVVTLNDASFKVRMRAAGALMQANEQAQPVLEQALAADLTPEHRQWVQQLLDRLTSSPPSPDQVRLSRTIELLERINTPASRRLLMVLAQGTPEATISCEAQTALRRLVSYHSTSPDDAKKSRNAIRH
jgi:WD40 repeat protein